MSAHGENVPKIRLSSLWSSYSYSIRHYSDVHNFFGVLKKCQLSAPNSKGVSFWFYRKSFIHGRSRPKIYILVMLDSDSALVRCYGVVPSFLGVLKNIKFQLKIQRRLAFGFTEKCLFRVKTVQKYVFLDCDGHRLHQWCTQFFEVFKNIRYLLKI
jgi:hypothetical protein